MKGMTLELFVYRAQTFAVKLQQGKPGTFVNNLRIGFGGIVTQFLMGLCFAKIYSEGEKQWQRKLNAVKLAGKKLQPTKPPAPSAK